VRMFKIVFYVEKTVLLLSKKGVFITNYGKGGSVIKQNIIQAFPCV
jgi:hypothetical protein